MKLEGEKWLLCLTVRNVFSYSEINGTVDDSVEFILANFSEMNKLWIQYQRHSQNKEYCMHEERQLHILVGLNFVRLSQLENIDVDKYKYVCDCFLDFKALLILCHS